MVDPVRVLVHLHHRLQVGVPAGARRRSAGHPRVRLSATAESRHPCPATGTHRLIERCLAALRASEPPLDVAAATRGCPHVLRVLRLPQSDLAIAASGDEMPTGPAPLVDLLLVGPAKCQGVDPLGMEELVVLTQDEGEPCLLLCFVHLEKLLI